jgi:hypothetical protein
MERGDDLRFWLRRREGVVSDGLISSIVICVELCELLTESIYSLIFDGVGLTRWQKVEF